MHTSHAGEELPSEVLDLAVWKRNKGVALEEVKDTLAQKIHDNANMPLVVEAVAEVDAAVAVFLVVGLEGCQNSEFDLTGITVFLDRSNDLDSDELIASLVSGLDDLAECALAQKLNHLICETGVSRVSNMLDAAIAPGNSHLSVRSLSGTTM